MNIPMTHLPLLTALTALNMTDAIPAVIQQDGDARQAASDQQSRQEQPPQGLFYRETGPDDSGRQNYNQQSILDDSTESMDVEDNHAFLDMYDLEEEFCPDEDWEKEEITESEQLLLVEQLQSLLTGAPISAHLHPSRDILELEYHNLLKVFEQLQDDLEQSENIEIAARIIEEEEEEEYYLNNAHD